jgi:type IV pilus assembly protein PilW
VATTTPPTLNLAGAWYASSVGTVPISSFTDQSMAFDLGASPTSASGGTPPSFQVIGVGDNNTLYSFDLLNLSGTQLQTRADNVFELHALYGIDNTGDGKIDDWVKADSGSYTPTALMDGSVAAATLIKNIRAIHVGLILRTALPERDNVTANPTLTLFSDVKATGPVAYSRDLTGTELKYRYRTVEATIPLRNNSF